jgi:hypothetical protein
MPLGNNEAMAHYQDTIKNRVPLSRISRFLSSNLRYQLTSIFGDAPIAIWGSQAGERNREKFERMSPGDDVLIVEGDSIKLIGKVAAKVESVDLSRELWTPITNRAGTSWELIYFIANPRELDVPFAEFCRLFGYREHFQLRGFTTVAPDRLNAFYAQYDDLYSVLVRIQQGLPYHERAVEAPAVTAPADIVEVTHEEIEEVLKTEISDHVRMQWKLARLGLKAGERVWVPAGDQSRLRNAYQFNDFDPQFTSGIDLPHSYIENIDVVWKQEFRIGAAYEIENSTSIYSGLLRFADLNIVAPNTLYPMFVVAPRNRKNRLREQLRRPTFRKLDLDKKVLFLPYEVIDEIDAFFEGATKGLSVDLIQGKAESVL